MVRPLRGRAIRAAARVFLKEDGMRFSRCLRSVMRAAAVVVAVSTAITTMANARPRPKPGQGFRLFSSALTIIEANRVQCRVSSDGQLCATGSSTVGGGIWPKGTADQYVFAGGLQVGGVVDPTQSKSTNGFAGDTAGAFFYNTSGTSNGTALRPIFASVDPADVLAWPTEARVPCSDPATTTIPGGLPPETIARCQTNGVGGDPTGDLFDPALQGTISASQGDHWLVYWEGDPSNLASRKHPLGILVETRALAWNFPTGNEDILYFVFTFYNVTSANPDDYLGIRESIRPFIQQKGKDFQALNIAKYGIALPEAGYLIKDIFVDVVNDMDVANANANYAGVNVPFALGYTYENDFSASAARALGWTFDPAIFGSSPFFEGVGFVGVKYLKSPINPATGEEVGLSLFGTFSNSVGSLTDPNDDKQLYRYMTGHLLPTDGVCSLNPDAAKICSVNLDSPNDMRIYQSSGPFDLGPGQFGSIVAAYIFAPPVADGNCPGAGCDVKAADGGDASRLTILGDPARMAAGVNQIDRMSGVRTGPGLNTDVNGDDKIDQNEMAFVPGSLVGKALVAQNVFDTRFLLPFSPEAPNFFLVPGDNQVTVLWTPSNTETTPDPFFVVASNPLKSDGTINTLYDPNFRSTDVEGYRVYRGRTSNPSQLTLIAQFDFAPDPATGKGIYNDFRGVINPDKDCAPELAITTTCPVAFETPPAGTAFTISNPVDLTGPVTQVKPGDRVALASGSAQVLPGKLDTAFADISHGSRIGTGVSTDLNDGGVPYAFTDEGVRNSVRYFYAVTAFDINSLVSGPSSLESGRIAKPVTPVASPSNVALADLTFGVFGDDGTDLTQEAVSFSIDENTGRFNGPPPPTTSIGATFQPLVRALLPAVNLTARVDSMRVRALGAAYPGDGIAAFDCQGKENGQGLCMQYFITFDKDGTISSSNTVVNQPILTPVFADPISVEAPAGQVPINPEPAALVKFGIPTGATTFNASLSLDVGQHGQWSAGENFNGRRSLNSISPGGSRWFEGANETLDDPTYSIRVGHLTGVDTILAPLSHIDQDPVTPDVQAPGLISVCMQAYLYTITPFGRQADMEVTWGDGGAIASVRDVTHHIDIPFKETPQGSWGFVPDADGNGKIDWIDINFVEDVSQAVNEITFCNADNVDPALTLPAPGAGAKLTQTAVVSPTSIIDNTTDPAATTTTGQGFGLYIAGHFHIFQLTGGALPAAGTKWTLRSHSGTVRASKAPETTNPSGYSFTPIVSSPAIPGLEVRFTVPAATEVLAAVKGDLSGVHTVPDPYYVRSAFESSTDQKILKFVGLPQDAIVRIYSASGVLVRILEHHSGTYDPTSGSQGSEIQWDLRNRNNQVVASGVYFYHVEAGDARRVGRFTVVNFAQ
jgi:hypothetical protein